MSEIKSGGLDQYGKVQSLNGIGGERVNVCKHVLGIAAHRQALSDVLPRAFSSPGIPVAKEPPGLFHTDGKRPDYITLLPWKAGKSVV